MDKLIFSQYFKLNKNQHEFNYIDVTINATIPIYLFTKEEMEEFKEIALKEYGLN